MKLAIIGPAAMLAAWYIISASGAVGSFFVPDPLSALSELGRLATTGEIFPDIAATLGRVGASILISVAIGLPLGLGLGYSRRLYESVDFLVDFFRSIPATAMFPLFLLVFGISDSSKIAVTVFASFLIIAFNTAYGVRHSGKSRLFAAKLMGASRLQIFRHIIFWESLPQTFAGVRTAASISLIIIIITEMFIGTSAGLGKLIIDFQYTYNITSMYAVIIIAGIMGYLINLAFAVAERRLIHWTGAGR